MYTTALPLTPAHPPTPIPTPTPTSTRLVLVCQASFWDHSLPMTIFVCLPALPDSISTPNNPQNQWPVLAP